MIELGSVYVDKKRLLTDEVVPEQSYVRIHCKPKRYPATEIDWKSRVHFENENFIVINKPAGFPIPWAVDNIRETVYTQMQKALGIKLFITQRLDVPTFGLMIFAKTSSFQRGFNGLLATQNTYKSYWAKTAGPPPLGTHVHFMRPAIGAPREVHTHGEPSWKDCRLEVLEVIAAAPNGTFFTKIHLQTGRTHQIRAQMKALGCPLLGDHTYDAPGEAKDYFLLSYHLRFTCPLTKQAQEFIIPFNPYNPGCF